MKVAVTGGTGFVGGWLIEELSSQGHTPVLSPPRGSLDIRDIEGWRRYLRAARPDAIAHFAGVASADDAARDPGYAMAINAEGTRALLEAVESAVGAPVLIAGSAVVYGTSDRNAEPIREETPPRPETPYARSKLAQENVAMEMGKRMSSPVAVARTFNLIGPRQRSAFVAPSLVRRVLKARAAGQHEIETGNLEVRRDFGDVRDAARAYAALLRGLVEGRIQSGLVVNVATGIGTPVRRLLETIAELLDWDVIPRTQDELIRTNEPVDLVGDPSRLRELTGWSPTIPIERSVADLVAWQVPRMSGDV